METKIHLSIKIGRPIEEVRRHYFDIPYHAAHGVHPDLSYTVRSISAEQIDYIQEVSILTLKHRDQCVQRLHSNGDVTTEINSGLSKGFKARYSFIETGPCLTDVSAELTIPLPGIRKWIAPLFRHAVISTVRKALNEDKQDLESLTYNRHSGRH